MQNIPIYQAGLGLARTEVTMAVQHADFPGQGSLCPSEGMPMSFRRYAYEEELFQKSIYAFANALVCFLGSSLYTCVCWVCVSIFFLPKFLYGLWQLTDLSLSFLVAAVQTDFHLACDFNTSTCNMITLTVGQYRLSRTKPQSSFLTALGMPELYQQC